MRDVLAVILGGGRGTRLYPLTQRRSKPAVPLAGKYRLVDIPISNCINAGLRQIFVLSQFQSASLHRHIAETYRFDTFTQGFVEILAAEQTEVSSDWYQGTADAVRKQLHRFTSRPHRLVVVLSGDQLYKMDFRPLVACHLDSGADLTVGAVPIGAAAVSDFGILQVDAEGRVVAFAEKPRTGALDGLALGPAARARYGTPAERPYLASMGIYVFGREVLARCLEDATHVDFGKEVIPAAIDRVRVGAHVYQGYWQDIGTVRSFYEANLALASDTPPVDFFDPLAPIYTRQRHLAGTRMRDCTIRHSIVAEGCTLESARVEESIIGIRTRVGSGARVLRSLVMGADFYEEGAGAGVPVGIGPRAHVEGAIVDKNARIGADVVIRSAEGRPDADGPGYFIREGIVVVPKNATIAPGTVI
jgi:glucose-1-phosphate adenylyltransferase